MAFTYSNYTQSNALKKKEEQKNAYSTYKESQSVTDARNALNNHNANTIADWTGGTYGASVQDTMNKINNREKFSYDLNADALYQQYKDKYINQGKLAMADTVGQASALTGGYGNSYAVTAGNQAYQASLQNLNDIVPQLYQMAMDKYNMEGDQLNNQLSMYQNAYNTEYGEYRDRVSDWENQRDYLSNAYNNAYTQDYNQFTTNREYYTNEYNNAYNREYGQYTDDYNRAFANYQQSVSEDQWNQQMAYQKEQDARNLALQYAQLAASKESSKNNGITATQTSRTSNFESQIMTTSEFARHNNKASGTTYKNYGDYIKAMINKWDSSSSFTDGELAYLKSQYEQYFK